MGPLQRPLPDNTQHSQLTDIHAPGEIRTCNPSKRPATDPCLRPLGHRDRQCIYIILIYYRLYRLPSYKLNLAETCCTSTNIMNVILYILGILKELVLAP